MRFILLENPVSIPSGLSGWPLEIDTLIELACGEVRAAGRFHDPLSGAEGNEALKKLSPEETIDILINKHGGIREVKERY